MQFIYSSLDDDVHDNDNSLVNGFAKNNNEKELK